MSGSDKELVLVKLSPEAEWQQELFPVLDKALEKLHFPSMPIEVLVALFIHAVSYQVSISLFKLGRLKGRKANVNICTIQPSAEPGEEELDIHVLPRFTAEISNRRTMFRQELKCFQT